MADDRLALSVTSAGGRTTRWGGGELNSKDVPTGLSFSTSIPGGFKDMSCALMRRLEIDYPDEALFDSVKVYGPGAETVWEGRMVQFPRQQADQFSVQPGAVGWAAHLRDDPSFREIFVDVDLGKWGGSSVQRQLDLIALGFNPNGTQVVPDVTTGVPSLQAVLQAPWAAPGAGGTAKIADGIYDSGGIPIGSVYYAWTNANLGAGAPWTWQVFLDADDRFASGFDNTANLAAAGPGTGTLTATTATRTFALASLFYNGASGGADLTGYTLFWTKLAVYGTHGLTKQGTASATEAQGFFASDVVANVVSRSAPLLTYTTGAAGSIASTTFVIPHLSFTDPTTAEDAISLVNGYHLYEWGVYDNRQFFWRPPDPGRCTWEARLSDGAQVSLEGDDANNIFNGVFVTYSDPSGRRSTVGPPGSVADATDATLVDTSVTNPVNAHGIPRRWGRLEISNTTTQAGAIQLGAVWLAEHNLPARRGQLTLTGLVQHPTQGKRPVWAVRAGDYIRIADRPNDPVRRIIETSYSHDSRQLTATLDNTVFKIEAIMERMGINLVGVI